MTLGVVGVGNLKSWKTTSVEGWGSTSPRYVTEITGTDPLSLGELGEGLILKNEVFLTYDGAIRSY